MKKGQQYRNIHDGDVVEFIENITEKTGTNLVFKYIKSKYKNGQLIVPLTAWNRMKTNWEMLWEIT